MKRTILLLLAMAVVLAGCSRSSVDVIAADDLPPDIYGGTQPTRPTNVVLYFVEGNRLVRVARTGSAPGTAAEVAVRGLLAGPTVSEVERDIRTEIPAGTELLGVTVDNGIAEVNLNGFQVVADPLEGQQEFILRMAQLVWTLDEIPEVTSVRLLLNGEPAQVPDQFKRLVSTPVARGSYSRFEPRSGRTVSQSPIQID